MDSAGPYSYDDDYYDYAVSYSDYEYYRLGSSNKDRLKLSARNENYLNWVSYNPDSFTEIQQCLDETIRIYLFLLKVIKRFLIRKKTSLEDKLIKLLNESQKNSDYEDKFYWQARVATDIFKISENIIGDKYGLEINLDLNNCFDNLKTSLDPDIENLIRAKTAEYSPNITPLEKFTQIELNACHNTLWQAKFKEIVRNKADSGAVIIALNHLYDVNIKNPELPDIYFSAAKLLAGIDKKASLNAYVNYFHLNLKGKAEIKKLPETSKKVIFRQEDDYNNFNEILEQLETDNNIELALSGIGELLATKKKKIILNSAVISEVKELHSDTLEKLNEVLKDEDTEEKIVNPIKPESFELSLQDVFNRSSAKQVELINFTDIQKEFLKILIGSSSLTEDEVSSFASSNNLFKSQLINGINELSFEAFDDNLIEEAGDFYKINSDYKDKIRI